LSNNVVIAFGRLPFATFPWPCTIYFIPLLSTATNQQVEVVVFKQQTQKVGTGKRGGIGAWRKSSTGV